MNDTTTREFDYLSKVEGLLAKAQGTDNADEAEAFMAAAQRLMTKHAIDLAMIEDAAKAKTDSIETVQMVMVAPYATAKANLLNGIARANNCRVVIFRAPPERADRPVSIVGYRSDIANVQALYGALSMYATNEVLNLAAPWGETLQAFRRAFFLGFASRIGTRLKEAHAETVKAAEGEHTSGRSVALVLADRGNEVDQAFRTEFPSLRRGGRTSISSGSGYRAGSAAASRADLGQSRVGPGRQALNR